MIVRPQRIPHSSPMIDTTGIVSVPASTNTDAIEKPVDRARGGIASESAAKRPGTTNARHALITTLAAIEIHTTGAHANTSMAPLTMKTAFDSSPNTSFGSRAKYFMPSRAPTVRPMSCAGPSTRPSTQPRAASSRPKTSR